MIYLVSIRDRIKKDGRWYHSESSKATIRSIQRPFSHLSVGPIIPKEPLSETKKSLKEYRMWLYKTLLTSHAAQTEFSELLYVFIQEGELILECSCPTNAIFCHGQIIRNALVWAEPFGSDLWLQELKKTANGKNYKSKYHVLDGRTTARPRCKNCGKPQSKWGSDDQCSGKKI